MRSCPLTLIRPYVGIQQYCLLLKTLLKMLQFCTAVLHCSSALQFCTAVLHCCTKIPFQDFLRQTFVIEQILTLKNNMGTPCLEVQGLDDKKNTFQVSTFPHQAFWDAPEHVLWSICVPFQGKIGKGSTLW